MEIRLKPVASNQQLGQHDMAMGGNVGGAILLCRPNLGLRSRLFFLLFIPLWYNLN